jgi:uncharacterized protein (DUF58 family)
MRSVTALGWMTLAEAAVLIAAVAWLPRPAAVAAGAALAAAWLVAWWLVPRQLQRIEVHWLLPRRATAGAETVLGATIVAPGGAPPCTLMGWDPRRRQRTPVAHLPEVGGTPRRVRWTVRFPDRGQVELPPLEVDGQQPFGLVAARQRCSRGAHLVVWPALGRVRSSLRARLAAWLGGASASGDAGNDDLARLRHFHPGDPLRRIHWRASARHGELLVGERHAPTTRRLAIALDGGAGAAAFERLIAAAATLADDLLRGGWDLSLHGGWVPGGVSGNQERLLGTLALATRGGVPLGECLPRGIPVLALLADATPDPVFTGPLLCLRDAELPRLIHLPRRIRSLAA